MSNRRGRPKGSRPKPKPTNRAYVKLRERQDKELLLISSAFRDAGFFVWRPPRNSNWRITVGRTVYEFFFQFETRSWKVLPVTRSLERDRIISLINKTLATKEDT